MERVYYHFTLWEDFRNGLYDLHEIDKPELLIKKCCDLLKDNKKFYETMIKVISKSWEVDSVNDINELDTLDVNDENDIQKKLINK